MRAIHRHISTSKLGANALAVLLIFGSQLIGTATYAQNIPPSQTFQDEIGKTFKESKQWYPDPVSAPKGAPNIVWILLDDVGYGAASSFGGLLRTPTFDSLASEGLRYTNFHTTGICAPSRAALLTGRNHHDVHMGSFPQETSSLGFPGYDAIIPSEKGFVSEILRDNGYNTFAVGKWGVSPERDETFAGPFDRWPIGKGFEYFFGFLGNKTDQYKPNLMENHEPVEPDGRHLNEQLTDKAISYIGKQKEAAPDKPFFLYFAPGAAHSPHQVDKYWSDQYKGVFDKGWDSYREEVFANQKRLGVIPANSKLPPRNEIVQAWDSLSADEQRLFARYMEVFAGFLTYTDHEIGRLVNYLKEIDQLDNTVIFLMVGDNGGSKEGSLIGTTEPADSDMATSESTLTAVVEALQNKDNADKMTEAKRLQYNLDNIDQIGTSGSFDNYPVGWAQATNTPFKMWKQDANAEGAIHNPLIVFHPNAIADKGTVRYQYTHLIDVLPTTLEIAGIDPPKYIRNVKQDSIQGTSFQYSFADADAPSRRTVQYYYLYGARAIYKDGWKASATHYPNNAQFIKLPVTSDQQTPDFDKDEWSLYNLNEDFTEYENLATKYPQKLEELKAVFDEQARINNVYPMIDWMDVLENNIQKAKKKTAEEKATNPNK